MQYVLLGRSGLKVSRICLGCMTFGNAQPWQVEAEQAKRVLSRAWDLGINFLDTANVYSSGRSEEILGDFISGIRDDVVVATKVYNAMGEGPNQKGLSRKHVMWQSRESLRRLKTSYIDLYQTHRWDYGTPIEETLSALDALVTEGKVRYIGASSMWAWQFAKALFTSDIKGYARFVSMQNLFNLLYREEEREMVPLCLAEGVGLIPWSPTAVGVLSGDYLVGGKLDHTARNTARLAPGSMGYKRYIEPEGSAEIVRRVVEVARGKGVTPVQVALAWLLQKGVTSPIIGTSSVEHLEEAVGALDVSLSAKEMEYVEEPYRPRAVAGHE